jgi:hypothetical protein
VDNFEYEDKVIDVGLVQFAGIWSELMEALFDCNKFGGTTAEIYAYRMQSNSPALSEHRLAGYPEDGFWYKDLLKRAQQSADTLAQILLLFKEHYKCKIYVNEKLFRKKIPPFDHRVHVRVVDAR